MGHSLLILMLLMAVEISCAEPVNKTVSGEVLWSSPSKDEGYVVGNSGADESFNIINDELDGGFPSLDGMLQWAIGHADPAKLQSTAQDVQQLSRDELQKRQMEIKELMEKLEVPSDAKLMQIAIDNLKNASLSLEDRHHALDELLILVEPIDNANELHKLGGLAVVIGELDNSDPGIRKTSAWVIGKASQNNPVVQKQVLELGALAKLMMMVKSCFTEEAMKALYAVSALIRNNMNGLELFYSEGGDLLLQGILGNVTADVRLRRKSVSIIADMTECILESSSKAELPFLCNCVFLRPVIDLTAVDDLDLQEKALFAIKNLLMLRSNEPLVIEGFCGLDMALERMSRQLEHLILEENLRDYAIDVEGLRKEVNSIYVEKLNKVSQVRT